MTRASKLIFCMLVSIFGQASCKDELSCDEIKDEQSCMSRSDCLIYTFVPFNRGEGGRFECNYSEHQSYCVKRHSTPIVTNHLCTLIKDREYIFPHWQLGVENYPCEGHENQYGDCINEDLCAYCGNGIQDQCERCDGELYEPIPCVGWLEGATGGMITRCNATCDDYDFSDCTTD